uniref:site-specific DNA-methyltransferase (cytosine-N(4)-specific) n=1 Tax=Candidatus Kentrum sp. MB TaxID=2138164 RepID=A0A450XPB0_9GAMM|nr:MAG: D12 class N6 adenine-specific DNA methyltransferase [Candidatus Kentron sp. MB]VFK31084.1 MAG: D12 class N6 adenine-specific DNA methyltransferase [Candidatus Kentron sp. MB]VFK75511.1 MAG: D12 class N6 adenine-specific DNA methyltransferase [Candidatus Kentron sp. MB]
MNLFPARDQLRQRTEYTYKFNVKTGRHGWLRLTPAYSLKIVEELVVGHTNAHRILDPFCGTGTTALCAAYHDYEGTTTDINPFLIWLAQAKTAHYSLASIETTRVACTQALSLVADHAIEPVSAPPIFNIERWWNAEALEFLRLLRAAIEYVTQRDSEARNLLLIAFCRTLIEQSNAAFNHQSMSFKGDDQQALLFPIDRGEVFEADVQFVLSGASENPTGSASAVLADSRKFGKELSGPFDLVITSPPYANRMSYIRELRPYMYWLGFLQNGRDAGELDWTAIGGTWGIATSRLTDWQRSDKHFKSVHLTDALRTISRAENKNGDLLAKYVAKYFDDMWDHFSELPELLTCGAELHYIVGNSTFYGTLVSTERLYAEMLSELGFSQVECRPIRKRNSKKELIEFDVVAKWK